MSVLLLVRFVAKPGQGVAVRELLMPAMGDGSGIEGCQGLELMVDGGNPDLLLIVEKWTSVELHKTYIEALTASGGLDALLALLAEPPDRAYYSQVAG